MNYKNCLPLYFINYAPISVPTLRWVFMKVLSFLLLLSASIFSISSVLAADQLAFLVPTSMQDVDIEIKNIGNGWLALHKQKNEWQLSPTTILVNHNEGIVELSSKYKNSISFIHYKTLKPGVVESATLAKADNERPQSFKFRNNQYQLVVKAIKYESYSPELKETFINTRNDVYFSNGKNKTIIYGKNEHQSCKSPFLLWAGDLDKDGKPDFIVSFGDDSENNSSTCLYLSNKQKSGELVKNYGCVFFSG